MSTAVAALRPGLAVLVSLLAIVAILLTRHRPNLREASSLVAALAKFGIVASMVPAALDGRILEFRLEGFLPGIDFGLRADPLGLVFALLASLLWIVTTLYSIGYMRSLDEHSQTRYFAAFAGSLSAAIGIAFASNLLTMFIFYEVLSVATYPLVAHDETRDARLAGRKYLLYTFFGGGVAVMAGTAAVFWLTGTVGDPTTAFAAGGIDALATAAESQPWPARVAFGLLVTGFGVKAAVMPLHSWLPDAMVAPTPVSGLLHAVAVVKSGVFGIARVVLDVFGLDLVGDIGGAWPLAVAAAATLVLASVIALRQDNLKRRLAYSTVSQLSYIVLGLAVAAIGGAQLAVTGALLHIPAHGFMKLTLFFCAGAIHVETHTDDISEMAGIATRMPLTMAAFAVAAAGMAGIPLLAGFVSKFYLLAGTIEAGTLLFTVALLASGVLNVAYFWPIVYAAFFETPDGRADPKPVLAHRAGGTVRAADGGATGWARRSWRGTESTWFILGPILFVAVGSVVLGLVPAQVAFLELIDAVVEVVLP